MVGSESARVHLRPLGLLTHTLNFGQVPVEDGNGPEPRHAAMGKVDLCPLREVLEIDVYMEAFSLATVYGRASADEML